MDRELTSKSDSLATVLKVIQESHKELLSCVQAITAFEAVAGSSLNTSHWNRFQRTGGYKVSLAAVARNEILILLGESVQSLSVLLSAARINSQDTKEAGTSDSFRGFLGPLLLKLDMHVAEEVGYHVFIESTSGRFEIFGYVDAVATSEEGSKEAKPIITKTSKYVFPHPAYLIVEMKSRFETKSGTQKKRKSKAQGGTASSSVATPNRKNPPALSKPNLAQTFAEGLALFEVISHLPGVTKEMITLPVICTNLGAFVFGIVAWDKTNERVYVWHSATLQSDTDAERHIVVEFLLQALWQARQLKGVIDRCKRNAFGNMVDGNNTAPGGSSSGDTSGSSNGNNQGRGRDASGSGGKGQTQNSQDGKNGSLGGGKGKAHKGYNGSGAQQHTGGGLNKENVQLSAFVKRQKGNEMHVQKKVGNFLMFGTVS